jgi:hypothetical protein
VAQFQNGHRKVGGRKPGVPNKSSETIRTIARSFVDDPVYRAALRERLIAGEAGAMESLLWQLGYGKPSLTSAEDGAVPTSITVHF